MSAARFTLVGLGSAAYLGFAILGWGGFAAFFSHPALTALVIALFAISVAALFAGGNLSPGLREDRSNRWVIVAFGVIGLLLHTQFGGEYDAYRARTSQLIPGVF
jgi:protein-S-isoprenylcysteine O-methyltransferase Ste14